MHTPAKGSPVRCRTRSVSPTRAHSGFVREKRRVRAPVGSRSAIWDVVTRATGSGQVLVMGVFWGWTRSFIVCFSRVESSVPPFNHNNNPIGPLMHRGRREERVRTRLLQLRIRVHLPPLRLLGIVWCIELGCLLRQISPHFPRLLVCRVYGLDLAVVEMGVELRVHVVDERRPRLGSSRRLL
jgi:hypothetical protein